MSPLLPTLFSSFIISLAVVVEPLGWLAWGGLVPLLVALLRQVNPWVGGLQTFTVGLAGTVGVFYGVSESYLWLTGLVMLLQAVWFFAPGLVFVWLKNRLQPKNSAALCALPVLWVGMEFWASQDWLLGRFANPTLAIGYTQHSTPLLYLAEWSGVAGVSFVVILLNVAGTLLWLGPGIQRLIATVVVAVVALLVGLSLNIVNTAAAADPNHIKVALVQAAPTYAEDEASAQFDDAFEKLLHRYGTLSSKVKEADLIVWPETAVRAYLEDQRRMERLKEALLGIRTALIGAFSLQDGKPQNVLLAWEDGHFRVAYAKSTLLPIFEDDLEPGNLPRTVSIAGLHAGLGICWESVFPGIARKMGLQDAEVLIYATSNIFAGNSTFPKLHFLLSRFRAVETGRYVLHASKGGPSGIFDPYGRVLQRSELGERATLLASISRGSRSTPFLKLGDFVGLGSAVSLFIVLMVALIAGWKNAHE